MKFGRISLFLKKADNIQPIPQSQVTTQVDTGLGQQHQDTPVLQNQDVNTDMGISQSTSPVVPKKRSLFKNLNDAKRETVVFSSMLKDILGVRRIKDVVEWREEYSDRLPKKDNFYRYIGYDKVGLRLRFLLIRGDKPDINGIYRIVMDKLTHSGNAKATYFNNPDALKEFVSKNYDIDMTAIDLRPPTAESIFPKFVEELRSTGDKHIDSLFQIQLATDEESRSFVARVIKEALKEKISVSKAVDIINSVEELSGKYYPIDVSIDKERYAKHMMSFEKNKDKYKEIIEEKVPFFSKDSKVIDAIDRIQNAIGSNNKSYVDMMADAKVPKVEIENTTNHDIILSDIIMSGETTPKPLTIPQGDFIVLPGDIAEKSRDLKKNSDNINITESTGVYMGDFSNYLQKMNAFNNTILALASEIANTGVRVTMDVKNETDSRIKIDDMETTINLLAGKTITIPNKYLKESEQLKEHVKNKTVTVIKDSLREKHVGFINAEQIKKLFDYTKSSIDSYHRYKDKKLKPFEYNMKMYMGNELNTWWREHTPTSFRVNLNQGDIMIPAPKEWMNVRDVNEHFSEEQAIAFAVTHELDFEGKKIWIIDEYQSDLVQQIGRLSNKPEEVTWWNPEGKSRRKLFQSKIDNYYGDWHKVFLNRLIKKAKQLGVDEIWLIRGDDIFHEWKTRGAFADLDETDPVAVERRMRLFRRVYDGAAMEYSQHTDKPDIEKKVKEYDDLVKAISDYYDAYDQLDLYTILTKPEEELTEKQQRRKRDRYSGLTEEEKRKKLEGIKLEEVRTRVRETNINVLKEKLQKKMEEVSVMRTKTKHIPPEIYYGKYHIIDVNKVPNSKLASIKNGLMIKYGEEVSPKEPSDSFVKIWSEKANNWIMDAWIPDYIRLAKEYGETLMSDKDMKNTALLYFWRREIPKEWKTNEKMLIGIRDHLRKVWDMPELDYPESVKIYIEGLEFILLKKYAGDNPDPSVEDTQTSPMEENFDNRMLDPDGVLYRRKKGRGGLFGDPSREGDLRTNLPAEMHIKLKTASDVVEQFLIQKEKEHVSEPEIRQELEDKGISEKVIDETYQTRSKDLYKELT